MNSKTVIARRLWSEGNTLTEALYIYGDPKTLQELELLKNPDINGATNAKELAEKYPPGLLGILGGLLELGASFGENSAKKSTLEKDLKEQLKRAVQLGQLIATGYLSPRKTNYRPRIIEADIIPTGNIDWENSECEGNGLSYVAVRISPGIVTNPPAQKTTKLKDDRTIARKKPGRPSNRELIRKTYLALLDANKLAGMPSKEITRTIRNAIKAGPLKQVSENQGLSHKIIWDEIKRIL